MTSPVEDAALGCTLLWDAVQGQRELTLHLHAGATVAEALQAARLAWGDPALEGATLRVGIWGEECAPDRRLHAGDRVEIYRPLPHDPREARRRRVLAARRRR
jgi:putative ubiquitin-RnfH superfamily antitoxin RatB of RatAB toxin-antitoxin module